jgi:hypothetical protein
MITHVDYDYNIWKDNYPNSILTEIESEAFGGTVANDHQRMTLFHADNNDNYLASDLYPYYRNDSLTATSRPAAKLFHKNSEGTKLMQGAILDIKQNQDGTIGFSFRAGKQPVPDGISEVTDHRRSKTIYTIDGRAAGSALQSLRHGVYIVGGKKVVR